MAKVLLATKDWRWLWIFGRFPVVFMDDRVRDIIARIAAGKFTVEEQKVNQNSKITQAEMIGFAQQVLEEYKEYKRLIRKIAEGLAFRVEFLITDNEECLNNK